MSTVKLCNRMSHSELSSSESGGSSTPGSSSEDEDEYGVSNFPTPTHEDKVTEAGEAVGQSGGGIVFADALQKILKKPISSSVSGSVVLAKRKTPNMKMIEQELVEDRASKKAKETQKEKEKICMVLPSYKTMNKEKELRKTATRGVVALFNAVKKAQDPVVGAGAGAEPVSKDKFFDMLKDGSKEVEAIPKMGEAVHVGDKNNDSQDGSSTETRNKSSWLDDNFMMGTKMKNWDQSDSGEDDSGNELEVEDDDSS